MIKIAFRKEGARAAAEREKTDVKKRGTGSIKKEYSNRRIPGLETGAVGSSLIYSLRWRISRLRAEL